MRVRHFLLNFLKLSLFIGFCQAGLSQENIEIVDESGLALPGVTVYLDGRAYLTSDLDGNVFIDENQNYQQLSISYLGYEDFSIERKDLASNNYKIRLEPTDELIEEVLIVGRTNAKATELPFRIETISAKEIRISQAQTAADAISKSGNVYVQKSQMGGGSPVVRGFEANKILLVVDGVRMNNAIYRGGHLQNAITIDPAILNRAELIFGPGSLLYGSDALGGVIHFRTKNPLIDAKTFTGGSYLRYSTANNEKTGHVNFSLSNGSNLASLTSISFSDFGDLRAGSKRPDGFPDWGKRFEYVDTNSSNPNEIISNSNPDVQIGTGYSQIDILQKFIYQASNELDVGLNVQYSRSSNIPRYDFLSEYRNGSLRYAEWNYGPQQRLMISPNFELKKETKFFDKTLLNVSYQRVSEDRITRNLNAEERNYQEEDLDVFGVNVDFEKVLSERHKVEYGASWYNNTLVSTAYSEDISTLETNSDILTRYPSDGSSLSQIGIYLHHRWDVLIDQLYLNVGTRYSNQNVSFRFSQDDPFAWPSYYYDGVDNSNGALVWMTGLNYQKDGLQIKLLGGSSFRAPNVDDLAKVRVKTDEITVPNPALKPEKTNNVELNVSYRMKKFKIGASAFYSRIEDIVIRRNFSLPDGSPIYVDGQDTLNVTANVNANTGNVKGLAFWIDIDLTNNISFLANTNYTHGETISQSSEVSPLDHIPPLYGKVQLAYKGNKIDTRIVLNYNSEKPIDLYGGSADNPEYALPTGTPSWNIFSLYSNYEVTKNWTVQAALENIFDLHYRPFASGVSAPGRNLIFSINYKW